MTTTNTGLAAAASQLTDSAARRLLGKGTGVRAGLGVNIVAGG